MFTDEQVMAALRAWWNLDPPDRLPWDVREQIWKDCFRETSMRDMRAALTAAAK